MDVIFDDVNLLLLTLSTVPSGGGDGGALLFVTRQTRRHYQLGYFIANWLAILLFANSLSLSVSLFSNQSVTGKLQCLTCKVCGCRHRSDLLGCALLVVFFWLQKKTKWIVLFSTRSGPFEIFMISKSMSNVDVMVLQYTCANSADISLPSASEWLRSAGGWWTAAVEFYFWNPMLSLCRANGVFPQCYVHANSSLHFVTPFTCSLWIDRNEQPRFPNLTHQTSHWIHWNHISMFLV